MKYLVEFEVMEPSTPFFHQAAAPSFHEALCRAIHEGDIQSLSWLKDNVQNVALHSRNVVPRKQRKKLR